MMDKSTSSTWLPSSRGPMYSNSRGSLKIKSKDPFENQVLSLITFQLKKTNKSG